MVDLVLFLILAAAVTLLWNEGCWGNGITLINIIFAGLFAFNYYEPFAEFLEAQMGGRYTYLVDIIAVWAIFAFVLGLLRLATDSISKIRVRFIPPVEHAGRVILGFWAAWVFVCFTAATFHMAPLPVNSFGGSFERAPGENLFFGFGPDRQWLGFVQSRSIGALGWELEEPAAKNPDGSAQFPDDGNANVFDPRSEFIAKYRTRRKRLETHVNRDANGSIIPDRKQGP